MKYEERYSLYTIPGTEPRSMEQIFFIAYALDSDSPDELREVLERIRLQDWNHNEPRPEVSCLVASRHAARRHWLR
ncbi:hypothetical protein V5799_032129 [Amblyomma americanum]|uniref:Uncharacterized protein n=1 Tax=Amblyomma americanum TaxID=6943 RepID=A0AAQ4DS23_AMBAM